MPVGVWIRVNHPQTGAPQAAPAAVPIRAAKRPPKAVIVVLPLLLLAGMSLGLWLYFGQREPYVQFVNGFDFDVTVTLTDEDGGTTTVAVPARGRVGADFAGAHTVDVQSASGTKIVEGKKVTFTESDKRKEGCFQYFNVGGSAAILAEDVVYGGGIKGGGKLLSGETLTTLCPTWGLETEEPPEAISVKEGTVGRNHTWLHYVDDGSWKTSIRLLLAKKPAMGDFDRIRAWNIAAAVHRVDPDNAELVALGPEFKAACLRMVDMFTTGPMAGQAKKKCLTNTKAMFPGAF